MSQRHQATTAACIILVTLAAAGCSRDPDTAKQAHLQRGDRYAADGRYQEAIVEYRNAVQYDPQFGEARLKLAQAYESAGDRVNAFREYIRAADALPQDVAVQLRAAQLLIATGQYEDAKTRAERALALEPDHVEAQIAKGNALAGLRDFEAAVDEISQAIEAAPDRSASYANLGVLEAARGNHGEAEAAFRKAIEIDPASADAQLALANFYWSVKRPADAEQALRRALDHNPRHVLANRALVVLYYAMNREAEAEPILVRLIEITADVAPRLTLVDRYLATGRTREARSLLDTMTGVQDPKTASAVTVRLAAIDADGGDRRGAYGRLDEVLKSRPSDPDALIAQANLFVQDRRYDEALAAAKKAAGAAPQEWRAHHVLGRAHAGLGDGPAAIGAFNEALRLEGRAMAVRLDLARLYEATGNHDAVVQTVQDALRAEPRHADARLMLATALMAKGDFNAAEPRMRELAAEFPDSAVVQARFGRLLAARGDVTSAAAAYERALRSDRANLEAVRGLAAMDLQQKNPAGARARVEAMIAADPANPGALMLAAQVYGSSGDLNAAEGVLRKVIELDPAQHEAYRALGRLFFSQNRLEEARVEYERLAQSSPQQAVTAHTMVGTILHVQNKFEEAKPRYEAALALDSRAAVAANNLAWLHATQGTNLDMALQLAQTAKAMAPNSVEIDDTLGLIYYKKGMSSLAIQALGRAVGRAPKNAGYRFRLGQAYVQAGNVAAARQEFAAALEIDPAFDGAAQARDLLMTLGQ